MMRMIALAAAAVLATEIPTERVEFLLAFTGGLGVGVERPPPQRLRVPVAWLDVPPSRAARERGAPIEARGVSFHVPDDPTEPIAVSISITAANWQKRARHYTDPAEGAYPNYFKAPLDASGLQALVSKDPSKHDNPLERVYLTEDPQLGFIHVKCLGIPERGPRNCRVESELTTYLVVSIYLPETRLAHWRSATLAAQALAKKLIV
jgi:hypothetical protein